MVEQDEELGAVTSRQCPPNTNDAERIRESSGIVADNDDDDNDNDIESGPVQTNHQVTADDEEDHDIQDVEQGEGHFEEEDDEDKQDTSSAEIDVAPEPSVDAERSVRRVEELVQQLAEIDSRLSRFVDEGGDELPLPDNDTAADTSDVERGLRAEIMEELLTPAHTNSPPLFETNTDDDDDDDGEVDDDDAPADAVQSDRSSNSISREPTEPMPPTTSVVVIPAEIPQSVITPEDLTFTAPQRQRFFHRRGADDDDDDNDDGDSDDPAQRRKKLFKKLCNAIFPVTLRIIWILMTWGYLDSINKPCDIPLKRLYWLTTVRLFLDTFRGPIMKLYFENDDGDNAFVDNPVLTSWIVLLHSIYDVAVFCIGLHNIFGSLHTNSCSNTAPTLYYPAFSFVIAEVARLCFMFLLCVGILCFACCGGDVTIAYSTIFDERDRQRNRRNQGNNSVTDGSGNEVPPHMNDNMEPKLRSVNLQDFPDTYPKECCICMIDFCADDSIVVTDCTHVFHKDCCEQWLRRTPRCPVCRSEVEWRKKESNNTNTANTNPNNS